MDGTLESSRPSANFTDLTFALSFVVLRDASVIERLSKEQPLEWWDFRYYF